MGNTVIIAEKPSVARDIAKVLGAGARRDGYLEGNGYLVTWAFGHLCNIAMPGKQNKAWAGSWSYSNLPMLPTKFKLEINQDKGAAKQFNTIEKLFNDSSTTQIIEATDAAREGELIFRRIYQLARCKKPFNRLWLSSMTDEAISKAFEDLKPGTEYNNLAASAYARAEADWLVGLNLTQGYTIKAGGGKAINVGRVMTPVLALLADRRKAIEAFVPKPYWELEAVCPISGQAEVKELKGLWHRLPGLNESRLDTIEEADALLAKCQGHPAVVESVDRKQGSSKPPLLFDLTSLQRDANGRFGFSAQDTLNIAQALYEKHKLITYPRTDSCYISKDVFKDLPRHFQAVVPHYPDVIPEVRKNYSPDPIKYKVVNDKKVSDHHAIIPTTQCANLATLKDNERKIYDLVCRRFMAAFMADAKYQTTTILLDINNEKFKTTGKVFQDLGWMQAEPWKIKSEGALPALTKGQQLEVGQLNKLEKQTKPPKQYTDSTLLRTMETAGKIVDDDELAEALKEKGLGTPATRAAVIEKLITVQFVERNKKNLIATDQGMKIVDLVRKFTPVLASPELTGEWEMQLNRIAKGDAAYQSFMAAIREKVSQDVEAIKKGPAETPIFNVGDLGGAGAGEHSKTSLGVCPKCGGQVFENQKAMVAPTGRVKDANSPSGKMRSAAKYRSKWRRSF